MKITNKLNFPAPLVSMAQEEYEYELNEYRATSLLKGIRETILERRYRDQIVEDVSDKIFLLLGKGVHAALEKYQETKTQLKEERIKIPIEEYVLSGQFDLYDDATGTVIDYKTTTIWKIVNSQYEDWRRQLLIYCLLLRQTGFSARRGQIFAILRDHRKGEAKRISGYPQLQAVTINFSFTEQDLQECEEWLQARFNLIREAEKLSDDDLPVCTPEERYNDGDQYAVMKKGQKKAVRRLNSLEEAQQFQAEKGLDRIEVRLGTDKKCIDYCSVNKFCSHYKSLKSVEGVA